MNHRIVLYENARGDKPVRLFINKLDQSTQAKYLRSINLLSKYGSSIGMPYSKSLTKHLYEIRVTGKTSIRIIYTNINGIYVLLHVFAKKTQKTPKKEIQTAESRRLTLI